MQFPDVKMKNMNLNMREHLTDVMHVLLATMQHTGVLHVSCQATACHSDTHKHLHKYTDTYKHTLTTPSMLSLTSYEVVKWTMCGPYYELFISPFFPQANS